VAVVPELVRCEFASIYRTLGVRVTLVEEKENLLPSWDRAAGEQIRHTLANQGVTIHLNAKIDLPVPQTWRDRPMFRLPDGTLTSPSLHSSRPAHHLAFGGLAL
jgi:hypothetical protein